MKSKLLILLVGFLSIITTAQDLIEKNSLLVNGYKEKLSGIDFNYHSSIPAARESMLIRAIDGTSSMEWLSDEIPINSKEKSYTLMWLAGIGSSPGNASFDVFVNDVKKFTFWTDGADEWTFKANDGMVLKFKKDLADQYGDRFGFMYLTIPSNLVKKGSSVKLKVVGGSFSKTSWYMTFKFKMQNGLIFKSMPAIVERDGKKYQIGTASIMHFGFPETAKLFIENKLIKQMELRFGYNYFTVEIPASDSVKKMNYKLIVGKEMNEGTLSVFPVKKWKINLVQHAHTDIGYTRSQTEILAEHLRFIDYALDYCDLTDNYPENAKFRWTCEASWAVDEYLKTRPEKQINRLKQRVKEGRIELTAMYFNFDELPDEQTLSASLKPLETFKKYDLSSKTAMQNDVNGIGWCMIDYYNQLGVKYLNMGTHGHRALICFDIPTLFWWESPSGKRMLAYRGEHYMTGNTVFKIQSADFSVFEEELLNYLIQLESKNYPHDLISIQHSGYLTDNSPPSMYASQLIKQWNQKYSWPKLKTATATEFFVEMEKSDSANFQVIRGAWPDWWTDGFGASAREVSACRKAQKDLVTAEAGMAMACLQGSKMPQNFSSRMEEINNALLFYTEHTVGYHASVSDPNHQYTKEQRAIKESYAWEAARRSKILAEESIGNLQSFVQKEKIPSIIVYNTLNWQRSGNLITYIDHQILPRYTKFEIVDENARPVNAQAVEFHSDGTYWAIYVENIPAFGYKKYFIKTAEKIKSETIQNQFSTNSIENKFYKILIDKNLGTISSITDKELNIELVDTNARWKMGQFIYELLNNRSQMESRKLDNFTRETLDSVWILGYENSAVWQSLKFRGKTKAANTGGYFNVEIRLYHTSKKIEFVFDIDKKMVTDPEGIYISFPFKLENGKWYFDVQGGEIKAGYDQIPGSSNDWNTVQNYARLSNEKVQILICSPETPLVQFGNINTGRYKAGAVPESTHIYAWPMNNYWVTNFNAEQNGVIQWSYSISSVPGNSQKEATHFGFENRTPFLSRVLPGGGVGDSLKSFSFIGGWPENLVLISLFPEENGKTAIVHLREVEGKQTYLSLTNNLTKSQIKIEEVNVLGEKIDNSTVIIQAYESKFFRISF